MSINTPWGLSFVTIKSLSEQSIFLPKSSLVRASLFPILIFDQALFKCSVLGKVDLRASA